MSSSRSIAAARNRRSGDPPPQQQMNSRPVTSIASHAAFAPQQQQQQQQQQQSRVRTAPPPPPQQQQQHQQQQQQPFSKLSISDAIGLVTLRLGRVEQFMIDVQEEGGIHTNSTSSLPDNTKLIDNSVLASIINRLDSLEKKEVNNEVFSKLEKDIKDVKELCLNLSAQLESFTKDTNDKFNDFETAITDIENSIQPAENVETLTPALEQSQTITDNIILSTDLKSIINQELANAV